MADFVGNRWSEFGDVAAVGEEISPKWELAERSRPEFGDITAAGEEILPKLIRKERRGLRAALT